MLKMLLIAAATARFAAGSQAQAWNACALLSNLEIKAILDVPVGAGVVRLDGGSVTGCRFAGKNGAAVTVLVRRCTRRGWAEEQAARMKRGAGEGNYREVPGVGERAFLLDLHQAGAALCVFDGGRYVQISAVRMGDSSRVSPGIEKLARKVLERMWNYRAVASLSVVHDRSSSCPICAQSASDKAPCSERESRISMPAARALPCSSNRAAGRP